jgi:hypothetical protein
VKGLRDRLLERGRIEIFNGKKNNKHAWLSDPEI